MCGNSQLTYILTAGGPGIWMPKFQAVSMQHVSLNEGYLHLKLASLPGLSGSGFLNQKPCKI